MGKPDSTPRDTNHQSGARRHENAARTHAAAALCAIRIVARNCLNVTLGGCSILDTATTRAVYVKDGWVVVEKANWR